MPNRVRFKFGDSEVEVEGNDEFIEKKLTDFFSRIGKDSGALTNLPQKIIAAAKSSKALSPGEFVREKSPKGGTATLLVLAKYLEDLSGTQSFRQKDINKLAAQAKLKDVHGQYFTLAVQQGYLRTLGRSGYALTITGEDVVAGMGHKTK